MVAAVHLNRQVLAGAVHRTALAIEVNRRYLSAMRHQGIRLDFSLVPFVRFV